MARVVVAMSGGVDSSTAAALAARAGHETLGVTLKLLGGEPTGFGCCGSPRDVADARRVAQQIGIAHYVLDFDELFEKDVVAPFVSDYLRSRTPNPCVECNRSVKFGALLRLAEAWKADYVATGHYARVEHDAAGGDSRLLRAADSSKDQTYFLYSLTQRELRRVLFPIGDLKKPAVRAAARELGLAVAEKEESQEICFIPGRDYRGFVRSRGGRPPAGEIRDSAGRNLGRHRGLVDYTVGQRKGLGLSGGRRLYVTGMDSGTNTLLVGEEPETLRSSFRVGRVSWTGPSAAREAAGVRIRHRGAIVAARLESEAEGGLVVHLSQAQRAVAPGQAAVFYDGEMVLGGGTIEEVL